MINQVICGDCLEVMKHIPNKSVDLVLTDPPYGILQISHRTVGWSKLAKTKDYGDMSWDKEIPQKKSFDEMKRISKDQIIFGGNYFANYLEHSPCWLVWDKVNGASNFADCELIWTSFKKAVRKYEFRWHGMLQEDMKEKDFRTHPTQKPQELISRIINDWTNKDILIIDPYFGVGTTGVACKKMNRSFIGIEKKLKYCEIAERRLAQEYLF